MRGILDLTEREAEALDRFLGGCHATGLIPASYHAIWRVWDWMKDRRVEPHDFYPQMSPARDWPAAVRRVWIKVKHARLLEGGQ